MNLKVNTFASEAGSFDLMGNGLESISCLGKVVHEERAESCCRLERLRVSGHDFKVRVLLHHQGRFHLDGRCVDECRVRFDG